MITYEYAKKLVLSKHPGSIVTSGMNLPDGYLFALKPKTWTKDQYVLDGFFKVSKENGKVSEYSPVMDPEEFKTALRNEIE